MADVFTDAGPCVWQMCVRLSAVGVVVGEFSESVPSRVDGCVVGQCVIVDRVDFVDQVVFELCVFVVGTVCAVLAQHGAHLPVAFAEWMDVLDRYGECYGVVEHVCYVEEAVGFGYYEQVVGFVVVVFAVFDGYGVGGVDGHYEVVEASVADECDGACDEEAECVCFVAVLYGEFYVEVGVVYVGALHVVEELLAEPVFIFVFSGRQAFEGQLVCCEFSHGE